MRAPIALSRCCGTSCLTWPSPRPPAPWLTFLVVQVLLSATVIFAIVKTAAYEFVYATTYFTLILGGLLSPAIEAILWNLLLVRTPQGYAVPYDK